MKMTKERQQQILDRLRAGCTRTAASLSCGVSIDTFHYWFTKSAKFAEQVHIAEATCEVRMTAVVANAALTDPKYALEWLKRRRPREWGEKLQVIAQYAQEVRQAPTADLLELLGYLPEQESRNDPKQDDPKQDDPKREPEDNAEQVAS